MILPNNMASRKPRGVHLVGSVPLKSAQDVFRIVSAVLGDRLRRIPDGETGKRAIWIGWQRHIFAEHPLFDSVPAEPNDPLPIPHVRLRPGVAPSEVSFGRLGYADAAKMSYAEFSRLKHLGVIPARCRFQVSLPTPLAPIGVFVAQDSQLALERPYEERLLGEVDEILSSIPHAELGIQWDVSVEMWLWEGWLKSQLADVKKSIVERLTRISARVASDVELGYHLCYGDWHPHREEPLDSGNLVEIANAISAKVSRPIQWIHMPVPRNRTDDAYFAPLKNLKLHPETELYLGLVDLSDGAEGTWARIETARRHVESFGVATECGMGRRPPDRGGAPETFPELLRIHAEVSDPVT
jgi:hypothetical protein